MIGINDVDVYTTVILRCRFEAPNRTECLSQTRIEYKLNDWEPVAFNCIPKPAKFSTNLCRLQTRKDKTNKNQPKIQQQQRQEYFKTNIEIEKIKKN